MEPDLSSSLKIASVTALAVDHAEVAHDARDHLLVAAVDQVADLALAEAPHLVRHLIEQMARQVEADGGLLVVSGRSFTPHGVASTRSGSAWPSRAGRPCEDADLGGVGAVRAGEFEGAVAPR